MLVASTVLAGVYAFIGLLLAANGGIWLVAVGLPVIIGVQYLITVQIPLWGAGTYELTTDQYPELHERATKIAEEMGVAKPGIYLREGEEMNAFALGRRGHGKIFFTTGILQELQIDELEPILAHEIAHLKNRDSILMSLGTSIVTAVSSLILFIFLIASTQSKRPWLVRTVGGITSVCVHLFLLFFVRVLSRYREYVADEAAVRSTGKYDEMINGLTKINSQQRQLRHSDMSATRRAICFANFSSGLAGKLLATHPSTTKRISRLKRLQEANESPTQSKPSSQDNLSSSEIPSEKARPSGISDQKLLDILTSVDELEFEHAVADIWAAMGWHATVTTATADKGIDVIATRDSPFPEKQLIQVKRYQPDNPVTSREVQQYASLQMQEDNVDAVVVVTTSRFTSNAAERAKDLNVKLVNGNNLCEMIRSHQDKLPLDLKI